MRLHEVISEDFDLEEGPIWDKTRQVGAAIGKGIGAVGQGIGAVAGVPAGIARSIKKGYNRASDTIAGGPDETPQQGGTQYQPSGQQSAAGQAQAVAGQSAEDPATLRKQARDLMARADEIERQQKQTSQSAPSQQTTQPNQSTGNATSGQQASQAQPNQTQQASQAQPNQTQQASQAQPNQTQQEPQAQQTTQAPADNVSTPSSTNGQINQTSTGLVHKADPNNPNNKQSTSAKPNADVTDVEPKTKSTTNPLSLPAPTQQKSKRNPNYTDAEMKAHQDAGGTYDDETGKMIPLQRAGGSYNNQIGNGKANYGVTTRFDPNTMKNVSTPLNSKAVNVVPNTTNPTTSSQDQTAKLRSNLAASQKARAASKFDSNQEYAKEGIQYYSRFLRGMI